MFGAFVAYLVVFLYLADWLVLFSVPILINSNSLLAMVPMHHLLWLDKACAVRQLFPRQRSRVHVGNISREHG